MGTLTTKSKAAAGQSPGRPGKGSFARTPRTPIASLEGTVLSALRAARTTLDVSKAAGARTTPAHGKALPSASRSRQPLRLAEQSRELREALESTGLMQVRTVRIRPRGQADRRYVVEYSVDPSGDGAVLLRVRPASALDLPPELSSMLTTQQAAAVLNVSRPYVAQLVDSGTFSGVERTRSGHRRIPAAEVERVRDDMRAQRRQALDKVADMTADLRMKELGEAKKGAKQRWVAKKS
jgi:excisionase family DNA binding protein